MHWLSRMEFAQILYSGRCRQFQPFAHSKTGFVRAHPKLKFTSNILALTELTQILVNAAKVNNLPIYHKFFCVLFMHAYSFHVQPISQQSLHGIC